jgi:hypothetical protein
VHPCSEEEIRNDKGECEVSEIDIVQEHWLRHHDQRSTGTLAASCAFRASNFSQTIRVTDPFPVPHSAPLMAEMPISLS